jgi:TetR/AcrR family transcriptional regulator, transcriptional repressor of aconitase
VPGRILRPCNERAFVLFGRMPKISDGKRQERRDQILEAAWRSFQRNGLHATTMDVIIRESGLSAGAVYSYFPGKEELIIAAINSSLSGVASLIAEILSEQTAPTSPEDLVRDIAAAIVRFTRRDGFDLKRIALLGWSEAQRNARIRETLRIFYLGFREQLAEAWKAWRTARSIEDDGRGEDVAKVVLAVLLGFVAEAAIVGDVEPHDMKSGLQSLNASREMVEGTRLPGRSEGPATESAAPKGRAGRRTTARSANC